MLSKIAFCSKYKVSLAEGIALTIGQIVAELESLPIFSSFGR